MLLKLPVGLFRVWPVFLNMCLMITLKSIIQDHWFWSLLYLLMQSFVKVQRTAVKCCKIWWLRWNTGNIHNYIVILKTWNLRQTCCLNYETIFLLLPEVMGNFKNYVRTILWSPFHSYLFHGLLLTQRLRSQSHILIPNRLGLFAAFKVD